MPTFASDNQIKHFKRNMEDRSRHTFDTWPTDLLIDYAIKIHHRGIRTRGPLTLELLGRVKAERPLVLSQVEQLFAASLEALDAHLFKEENVLFPYIEELHEAAKLDGCSNWRFLATIVIPLARPALGALGAYVFLLQWNQYLWPLLVTNSDRVRTVQIGVSQMYDIDSESIALMMSAVIVVLIPSLSIFVFMQKQLINGLMAGAVKG